jgi:hypothetical protein
MGASNFDQPSVGNVASNQPTLLLENTGSGVALAAFNTGKVAATFDGAVEITGPLIVAGQPNQLSTDGDVRVGGRMIAAGDVAGARLITDGDASVGGKLTAANIAGDINVSGRVLAVGDVKGARLLTDGVMIATGDVSGARLITNGDASVGGKLTAPNIAGDINVSGRVLATDDVKGARLLTDGIMQAGGDVSGARLITNGDAFVGGTLTVAVDISLTNADCAEEFDVAVDEFVEAGTVMVLGEGSALHISWKAYDKRVAGIVSGAGDLHPAIVLDKKDHTQQRRAPIALIGKVYCKVDASYGAIEVGDLLTTSDTCGHAMKADDPHQGFGSIIGKALSPFESGCGLIPVLVALQ